MKCEYEDSDFKCNANAINGDKLCVTHSQVTKSLMADARKRGGTTTAQAWAYRPITDEVRLDSNGNPLLALLNNVINWVLEGRIDTKRANAVILAVREFQAIKNSTDTEKRLMALEKALQGV